MVGGGQGAFIGDVHRKAVAMDGKAELVCGAFSQSYDNTLATGEALGLPRERLYRTFDLSYTTNADPAVWILDRLSVQTLRDSGGALRGEQRFYYDGSLTGPPTFGDLTLMQALTGAGSQTVDSGYSYDVYGNLLQARAYEAYGTAGTAPGGASGPGPGRDRTRPRRPGSASSPARVTLRVLPAPSQTSD